MNEDQEILDKEFKSDSDRAVAIVGASYLDELLKNIITEYIVKDSEKSNNELFSGNGPLSTFSSRINISYRFGIISEEEKKILNGIRGIRNDFAHKLSGATFEDQSIKQRALNLSIPRTMLMPRNIPIPSDHAEIVPLPTIKKADENDARAIFQEAVIHVACLLRGREAYCITNKIKKADNFKKATEPAEQLLRIYETQFNSYSELIDKYSELIDLAGQAGRELDPEMDEYVSKHEYYKMLYKIQDYCIKQAKEAHEKGNYA